MQVTHINETSDADCSCGSWLMHWKAYSGKPLPPSCSVTTCYHRPTVGAHVQKENDPEWYIVPLCEEHNESTTSLEVGNIPLVSANRAETCERVAVGS